VFFLEVLKGRRDGQGTWGKDGKICRVIGRQREREAVHKGKDDVPTTIPGFKKGGKMLIR